MRLRALVAATTCLLLAAALTSSSGAQTTTSSRSVTTESNGSVPAAPPPKISRFYAYSASFISPDEGFVLGVVPCAGRICVALSRTLDRGKKWTALRSPPANAGNGEQTGVSEVHFADSQNGWVFGGEYGGGTWVTHNGGRSWHAVHLGGPAVAMASGDGMVYALVEDCAPSPSCTSTAGYLDRSPVSQNAWSKVPGFSQNFLGGCASLVVEGQSVFIAASEPDFELLDSPDGVHFTATQSPCSASDLVGPLPVPVSIAAADPSDLTVACLGQGAAGSEGKQLYVSSDAGQTFQRFTDPPVGGDLAEVSMPSSTTVLLAAESGATFLYRLASPDTSWVTALSFGDGGVGLSDLAFVDSSDGSLIHGSAAIGLSLLDDPNPPHGLGELYLTNDGGAHWHLVHIPE